MLLCCYLNKKKTKPEKIKAKKEIIEYMEYSREFYSSEKAYMDTKLMLTAWSGFLDKRLQKIGASVRSYSVHPGFVKTEMWNRVGWVHKIGILHRLFFEVCAIPIISIFPTPNHTNYSTLQRTHSAAESIAYTSLSPQLEGKQLAV